MNARKLVVGPRLRRLLIGLFLLFATLSINSVYLAAVTLFEWWRGQSIQNHFYLWMFLLHLALGLLIIVPTLVYGVVHWRNAKDHRNRRAVAAGYWLFGISIVVLLTGLTLTRGLPIVELKDPAGRTVSYWMHVLSPLVVAWLFVLHRLAGKRIQWRAGLSVLGVGATLTLIAVILQSQDPRKWNQVGPASGEEYFFPSLARTSDGQFIRQESLMMDGYCQECHADVHASWSNSVHKFSSFNNPAYRFSVRKTREFLQQRDGNVQAVRFCAGCHDPVPFFSGAMDDPTFGDHGEASAEAGITCSVCHSVTHINSPRGNSDFTIEEPLHYPFAYSDNPQLQWLNRTLVKAKPEFHKKTFLKPLHKSTEFCGSCHKVHLPEELNAYRWLRGQNHYDSFLLSGVSGHGVASFYYPDKAQANCNGCHMQSLLSDDFGARRNPVSGELSVSNHLFPAANTGIAHLLDLPESVNDAHTEVLEGALRVDVVGVREGGRIDGRLLNRIDGQSLVLEAGKQYLFEVVVRTLTLGHHFTQGTADSNQIWLHTKAVLGDQVLGRSGELSSAELTVDPWAHFVNAFVIDQQGNRIDRRNPENIFTQLYNNQIPPGAADVVHYLLTIPEDAKGKLSLSIALNYRKFDTAYLRQFHDMGEAGNDLPITRMAQANVEVFIGEESEESLEHSDIPKWQRWNDYGIGLLRREQFRQAEGAFKRVEQLGWGHGAVNLARVYLAEGRVDEAADALARAPLAEQPAYPWSVAYFTAQVNMQNGFFDEAIQGFENLTRTEFASARERGFNFSKDYRLLNQLALALSERAKLERGPQRAEAAAQFRRRAVEVYLQTLALDPENASAHYGLAQMYRLLQQAELAQQHQRLYLKYKPDDNAKDVAVQRARARYPAADHAANQVVIIDLNKDAN